MKPMRILMLNYEFPPIGGGAGNAHFHMLQEYAGMAGLKVDVLTSAPEPGYVEQPFAENITLYKVGIRKKNLHFWRRTEVIAWLAKSQRYYHGLLNSCDYDLAHAFFGFPTGWLCYRRASKLPYIISLRGSDVPGDNSRLKLDYKLMAPVFRGIWRKARRLVACSEGLKNRAMAFMPKAHIDVIPNGVDLEQFHPAEKKADRGPLRLVTVGRLSGTKRIEMLIDSVESLHKDGLDVRLTVVGGGAMQTSLEQLVAQRALGAVVGIAGRLDRDKMPTVYREHDIYISASMQEGMSNAMLEAMASGLPIITTRCEGVTELVGDNGVIVEDNAVSIADAVKKLARTPDIRQHMSLIAREQASQFSWNGTALQYLTLYESMR